MDIIQIEIMQWDRHQPRKDIKHPTWFALSNRVLEDAKLFDLTDGEWKALLYIFCQASQQNSANVRLSCAHAKRVCEIPEKTLRTAIDKLAYAGVTSKYAIRTDTLRDTTLQTDSTDSTDKTDKTDSTVQAPGKPTLHPLAVVWNENRGDLGEVREVGKERSRHIAERLKECSDLATWADVVRKIAASDFCCGRIEGKKWKATFDFLLRPKTRIKALEGAYDNFDTTSGNEPDAWEASARKVLDSLIRRGTGTRAQQEIEQDLGTELYRLAVRAGTQKIRDMQRGPYQIKNIASLLQGAVEGEA